MQPKPGRGEFEVRPSSAPWVSSAALTMLLVRESLLRTTFGWQPGAGALLQLPTAPEQASDVRGVLVPGGRAMLVPLRYSDPSTVGVEGGVARIDLRTGASAVARFTIPNAESFGYRFGGSPDGRIVAVDTMWLEGELDMSVSPPQVPTVHAALNIASVDGTPARRLDVLTSYRPGGEADDLAVQWSPDGSRVAWSLYRPNGESETRIYDVEHGAEVQRVEGMLCGSASWAPDSNYLLVHVGFEPDVWLLDLVRDTRRQITVLPPLGDADLRPVRALGIADTGHVVTARDDGLQVAISVVNLTSGDSHELMGYSDLEARYPVITAMPYGTWTTRVDKQ